HERHAAERAPVRRDAAAAERDGTAQRRACRAQRGPARHIGIARLPAHRRPVGDKLRDVLNVQDIGIRWYDHDTRTAHFLYEYEHGKRIEMAPVTPSLEKWLDVISDRETHFLNTREEVAAAGVVPGTECALSAMSVRIISRDRVVGIVLV